MKLFPTLLLLVVTSYAQAQLSDGGTPISWKSEAPIRKASATINMPSIDLKQLLFEDSINAQVKTIPPRFAFAHEINISTENGGEWTNLSNGDRIWRLQLNSENAKSLNVTFSQFDLPVGGKLFLYSSDKSYVIGAFTNRNNNIYKQLGTTPIPGSSIVIEYYEPKAVRGQHELEVATLAHDYRGIFGILKNFGDSGSCNNDVACPLGDTVGNQINAVTLNINENGTRWCSGTMIGNSSNSDTPYYLTANHCLPGNTSNLANWVFVFNYQSATCNGSDGSLTQSISGATLRATDPASDFALFELTSVPPIGYNPYYAGWDKSENVPSHTFGIHHPSGDVKKISYDYDAAVLDNNFLQAWKVEAWDDGTTEGGSSGSALFDQNKRIVGQLYGGFASCSQPNSADYYGRLSSSWDGSSAASRLKDWLDPTNINPDLIDGYNPHANAIEEYDRSNLELYPNPSNTLINIILKDNSFASKVEVLDITGKLALTKNVNTNRINLDVSSLQNGQYIVRVISNTRTSIIPFIVAD